MNNDIQDHSAIHSIHSNEARLYRRIEELELINRELTLKYRASLLQISSLQEMIKLKDS